MLLTLLAKCAASLEQFPKPERCRADLKHLMGEQPMLTEATFFLDGGEINGLISEIPRK